MEVATEEWARPPGGGHETPPTVHKALDAEFLRVWSANIEFRRKCPTRDTLGSPRVPKPGIDRVCVDN